MNDILAEFLRGYSADNQWTVIMPEIMMAILALGMLGADLVLPKRSHSLIPSIAIWGQALILIVAMTAGGLAIGDSKTYFSGMIAQTDITQIMRGFFLVSSILVCYLGRIYLSKQNHLAKTEFYHLVLKIGRAHV